MAKQTKQDMSNEIKDLQDRVNALESKLVSYQTKAALTEKIMDALDRVNAADNGLHPTGNIIIAVSQLADVLQVVVTQLGDFAPGNEEAIVVK